MAQVLMGKLLPNLKVTLDDTNPEENIEEGEITEESDDPEISEPFNEEKHSVDIVRSWMKTLHNPKVYENKNGEFITGLDLSSEVVLKKLEERAARFGLEKDEEHQITQDEINTLYDSMGIDIENRSSSSKTKNIRLDSIHMRGVNEMNTNEIFQYFKDYGPSSVEWINDFSCNVIWLDETSPARALLGMSRTLVVKKKKDEIDSSEKGAKDKMSNDAVILMSDSEDSVESVEKSTDVRSNDEKEETSMEVDEKNDETVEDDSPETMPPIDVPVPPGFWRLGMPHPKAKALLLRFSTKDDRKLPGAEKRSQYYQKYGNPNYGGLRGLISTSRKRKIQAARNREVIGKLAQEVDKPISPMDSSLNMDDIQNRPTAQRSSRLKQPRMRMYADDEEEKKLRRKKTSEESSSKSKSIFNRLGNKYTKEDLYQLGRKFSNSDEEESEEAQETRKVTSRFNIWNDLAKSMADEENGSPRKDFKRSETSRDLRSSISTSFPRKTNLQSSQRTNLPSSRYRDNYENGRSSRHLRHKSRELSSSHKRTNFPSAEFQGDLRSKIRKIKDDSLSKHRSPLCKEDDTSSGSDE